MDDSSAAGPSRATRSEPAWVRHAIWWRLYPLGFVGAFPEPAAGPATPDEHRLLNVIGWLDHVVELGANGVALGPVFRSSTHGYDTLDHFELDPRLGTDEDFDALVAAAHERGLRVQLDGVFNHVGREHALVQDALRRGLDNPAGRWLRTTTGPDGAARLHTFEGHDSLVTLAHDEPEVRDLVARIMRHWLDRGADAWRLDAAYQVPTDFWAAVLREVRASHPDAWFEAEVIHGDYAAFVEASTVDTVTQYELWKAIWSSIESQNFWELDWALRRHDEMLATFAPATFVGNHDVTRIASQIGDRRHLPHAVVLLAMLGGTPTVYAGDEYGLAGVKEERAGGDDAIRPTFPAAGPAALAGRDEELFRVHQVLLGLRRRHPWLHRATTVTERLSNRQYVVTLTGDGEALTVELNLDDAPAPAAAGELLAADPETRRGPTRVAPHGWAVRA